MGHIHYSCPTMPSIVHYLDRVRPARYFDEVELATLDVVHKRTCLQLNLAEGDNRRETVAMLVFQVADLSRNPEEIIRRVIAMYQRPA